jgi:hypothetical protein
MSLWHIDPLLDGKRKITKKNIQQPLLSNAFLTSMFEWQQLDTAAEELCFLCGPCRDVISRTIGAGHQDLLTD